MRDTSLVLGVLCVAVLSFGVSKIESEREVWCSAVVSIEGTLPVILQNEVENEGGTDTGIPTKNSAESVLAPSGGSKTSDAPPGAGGRVVASKNGTKYHHPWCAGASQIKEENKIWYETEQQAQQAGLTKAKNCQ